MTAVRRRTRGWRPVVLVMAAAWAVFAAVAGAALAQPAPPIATVELSGVVILRVRDPGAWPSVYARADEVYRRLNEVLQAGPERLSADDVAVVRAGSGYAVTMGGRVLATATPADARLNGTTPAVLARIWASNAKAALRRFIALHASPMPPVL